MEQSMIIPGLGSEKLTKSISCRSNIPLCDIELSHFGNGETRVEINSNMRNQHVIIVAQMRTGSVNDDFMSLLMLLDACRRSDASKLTVVLPYYPYSRSDKKDRPRVPICAAAISHVLNQYNIDNLISLDLHAGQLQGLFDKGFHNLYMINKMCKKLVQEGVNAQDHILISPDVGGIKRIESYSQKLKIGNVVLHKVRDYTKPGTVLRSIIIGDEAQYKGKIGVLIDDMCDSMGTMVSATNELVAHGIKHVVIVVTHGIFSGKAIERINNCENIHQVICTSSLPQEHNQKLCKKLDVLDCAELVSEALEAITTGESVSKLFT